MPTSPTGSPDLRRPGEPQVAARNRRGPPAGPVGDGPVARLTSVPGTRTGPWASDAHGPVSPWTLLPHHRHTLDVVGLHLVRAECGVVDGHLGHPAAEAVPRVVTARPDLQRRGAVGRYPGHRRGRALDPVEVDLERRAVEDGHQMVPAPLQYRGADLAGGGQGVREVHRLRPVARTQPQQVSVARRRVVLLQYALV